MMERYSVIEGYLCRKFLLLQGMGCRWRQCTFCDYHTDASTTPYESVNSDVLDSVTGKYGVLYIINSGSALELDSASIQRIRHIVWDKGTHTLWFEMCYMLGSDWPILHDSLPLPTSSSGAVWKPLTQNCATDGTRG